MSLTLAGIEAAAKKGQWVMRAIYLHELVELVGVLMGKRHNPFLAESVCKCFQCQIQLYRSAMLALVPQRILLNEFSAELGLVMAMLR